MADWSGVCKVLKYPLAQCIGCEETRFLHTRYLANSEIQNTMRRTGTVLDLHLFRERQSEPPWPYLHGLLHQGPSRAIRQASHCRQVHTQGPRVPMSPYYTYTPLEQALTGLGGLPIVHLRSIKELTMPATARDAFSHNGAASDSRNYCRRSYYHSDCHGPSRAETTVFRLCPPRYRRLTTGLPRRLRGRNALDCAAQGHHACNQLPGFPAADGGTSA